MAFGPQLACLPGFASTLQYLKKYFKLVIISNVDNENFTYSHAKLHVP